MTRLVRAVSACLLVLPLLAGGCSQDPEYAKREYVKSGDRYYEQKKYKEAIVQYRNALQQDPRFGEARLKLAHSYTHAGDRRAAAGEYVRAADLLPDNFEAQLEAAAVLVLSGRFEDAKIRAERALAKNPRSIEAHIVLGNALAALKDFDAAIEQLDEAIRIEPSAGAYATLGNIQLVRGAKPEAETAFRNAIEVAPKNPVAHLAYANYLMSTGRVPDAERELETVVTLDDKNPIAHRALAILYIASRRMKEAEPHLKVLADLDRSPQALGRITLAEFYIATKRVDDAVRLLQQIETTPEGFAPARTRMAALHHARGQRADAHRAVDEVLAKRGGYVPALLVKARLLAADRNYAEALARVRSAIKADPTSIQAHYLEGRLLTATHQRGDAVKSFNEVLRLNPKAVAAQLRLAELNLIAGQPESALQFAESAAKAAPVDPTTQLVLVRSLVARGQLARAATAMKRLLAKHGRAPAVLALAGTLATARGDANAARRHYLQALSLQGDNLEALVGLTTLDLRANRSADAFTRIDVALSREPKNARLLTLGATARLAAGDHAAAESLARKAIEADPAAFQAYAMLGRLYIGQRRLAEARAAFDSIAARQPDAIAANTLVAMLYEAENNRAEARKRYERVLQIDPRAAVAANNLAWMYVEDRGNLDIALQLAQTAKARLPDVPAVDDTLGWIYYKKDLALLAIPPLEQAVAKEPKNAVFQYHLGMAYLKAGNKVPGRRALEQALLLQPDLPEAGEVRETLKTL
jgi:tetratricopeptide (TPR) repeat protein